MRGDLPIKTDTDVRDKNLILFGDPGSNLWLRKALPKLPVINFLARRVSSLVR